MARPKKSNTIKSLEAIDRDLSRLRDDVEALVKGVRADTAPILSEVQARLSSSLEDAQAVVAPLVAILKGSSVSKAAAKPSKKTPSPSPTKRRGRKKTGRRGVKANLTAEQIKAALDATGGVKSRAAAKLGVTVTTFDKYLKATGAGSGAARKSAADRKTTAAAKKSGGRRSGKARARRESGKVAGA